MCKRRGFKEEEEEEGEPDPSGRKTLGQQITGGRGAYCLAQLQCNGIEMHCILFTQPASIIWLSSESNMRKKIKTELTL